MNLIRIKRLAGTVIQIPRFTRRAMNLYHGSMFGVLGRIFLALRRRYLVQEAWIYGLLDPSLPLAVFDSHVSRSILVKLQKSRNPVTWDSLLADKTMFYRYSLAAGLPVPALYAIFCRHTPGWTCSGKLLYGREEWATFFEKGCPSSFVIKPDRGMHGDDIWFLEREGGRFKHQDGQRITAGEIYDRLISTERYEMFAIQERLRNHDKIVRFTGSEALHTARMVTIVQPSGESLLAYAHFKLVLGNHYFDNYGSGEEGNLMVGVDIASGTLTQILLHRGTPLLLHPRTGRQISGFQIPLWRQACATINQAAKHFSPVGTIGWDLAVTPHGPVVIEGNIWYDPPNPPDIQPFLSVLELQHDS